MQRWTKIFKILANINRLKIIEFLSKRKSLSVGETAGLLHLSLKATSKHLLLLHHLDIVESVGKKGHVFYSLNPKMPKDIREALKLFLS